MMDQEPRFNAKQLAAQQEIVGYVRELARRDDTFCISGDLIVESARAFEIPVTDIDAVQNSRMMYLSNDFRTTNTTNVQALTQAYINFAERVANEGKNING